ncbi:MAG: efflux RND transporter periplasmic adaptor subunit [Gemmataceae bacterium]
MMKNIGCGVALISLALPAVGLAQFGPAPVIVTPIVEREVAAGQTFVGTVRPKRVSTVGSAVNGRVEEFLVNEGDRVRRGQPLAKLRTKIIEAELGYAKGELETRKAELLELENGSRPEEIDQARAKLARATAMRTYRKAVQQRTAQLVGRGVSQEDLEQAIAMAQQAEAEQEEAQAALKLLELGPRAEVIARARARVAAQEAEVQRIEEQLDRHTVYAPFDGYIVAEHTEIGHWLMQGAPVVEIMELDEVDVEVAVLEDYIRYLQIGGAARVEVGALPDQVFTGRIALIVPSANLRARTFPVKVRVANETSHDVALLKAGMFARVTLPVGRKEPALLVPKDALVLGGPTPLVYVVDADSSDPTMGKARPVPVQLGVADGSWIQVKGELQAGQVVVSEGNERLRPAQDVRIVKAVAGK